MLGVGTECPPTIFLYSSHRSLFYGILRAVLGSGVSRSGLVIRRILGGLLSVARLFSYMNDTHGDLPRCLFPRVRAGCLRWFTEPWKQEDVGGVTECRPLLSYMNNTIKPGFRALEIRGCWGVY